MSRFIATFRQKAVPYLGPLFSVILALHWFFSELERLDVGVTNQAERSAHFNEDIRALREDIRALRAGENCRGMHEQ